MVRVDVAGGGRAQAELAREFAEGRVPASVPARVRPLELDEEAVAAKSAGEAGGRIGSADGQAVPGAAGQADETLVPLFEQGEIETRVEPLVSVRGGEETAEVGVALRRLDEQGDMGPPLQAELGTGDRPDAERLRRVRELERAADAVVVGERERLVAEVGGPRGELFGLRGTVEERIR